MNIEIRKDIAYTLSLWLKWIADGAEEVNECIFSKDYALCSMLSQNPDDAVAAQIEGELIKMFREDGLDVYYPFNGGSGLAYSVEVDTTTNTQRVEWAKSIVARYPS